MITREELFSILRYDQETGLFFWKVASGKSSIGKVAGCVNKAGYVQIRYNGKTYKAHRLAFLYMVGNIPKIVDHKDRNKQNNAWCNLEESTVNKNNANRVFSRSGVKGVYFDNRLNKWYATTTSWTPTGQKIKRNLGYRDTVEEAAKLLPIIVRK